MRRLPPFLTTVATLLVLAACQAPIQQAGELSDEDIAAIKTVLDGFAQAELDGDWQAAAALLTEDFVGMPADMPKVEGRAAWLELAQGMDVTISDLVVEYDEIDGSGDIAFARGSYTETFVMGDSEPTTLIGKYLWVFEKQPDGRWQASVGISNSDAPSAEPERSEGT